MHGSETGRCRETRTAVTPLPCCGMIRCQMLGAMLHVGFQVEGWDGCGLGEEAAWQVAAEVAAGLAFLHTAGVLHLVKTILRGILLMIQLPLGCCRCLSQPKCFTDEGPTALRYVRSTLPGGLSDEVPEF